MQEKNNLTVKIAAPGRLHLGFLDLHGGLGRLYGSLGLALEDISTVIDARHDDKLLVTGPDSSRAHTYAERMLAHLNVRSGLRITIRHAIPEHAGLGSGTQMALAIGTAINKLFGANLSLSAIARILDRGNRSGIGIGTFKYGGFIVDGGRNSLTEVPPIISQLHFPDSWRFILVLDRKRQGVHGLQESKAFVKLGKMNENVSAVLCRLLLMQVLPAVAEQDCKLFGAAINEIQVIMGAYFKTAQAGLFASPAVARTLARLRQQGATGIGQSSWGPTGFAIYASETDAFHALKELRRLQQISTDLELLICRARNERALIEIDKSESKDNMKVRGRA